MSFEHSLTYSFVFKLKKLTFLISDLHEKERPTWSVMVIF